MQLISLLTIVRLITVYLGLDLNYRYQLAMFDCILVPVWSFLPDQLDRTIKVYQLQS